MKLDWENVLLDVLSIIGTIVLLFVIGGLPWWTRAYNLYVSPCTEVYNDNELIFRGNSYYYTTESRGTGTMFKQYDERVIFQRQIKEVISDKIQITTISCDSIK